MNRKALVGEVTVVTGAPKGIWAVVARLTRRRSVVDIVERFQTQHAPQEERDNGATAPGVRVANGMAKVPRSKDSSPSHGGLIVGRLRLSS